MTRRRTRALALVGAGTACLVGAVLPGVAATAAVEPGSGLGSFGLAANAPAFQLRQVDGAQCGGQPAATGGCEGVVPEAVSTLSSGPVGYGLAAVVWPGTLAGNLGSLIIVAGGEDVPPEATMLNSPVRAEARTGGPPKVTNTSFPGTSMTATATGDAVTAEATVSNRTVLPGGTLGNSAGRSSTVLTGAKLATATAHSEVQDVSLAGVVTIRSVVSDAVATTDGTRATASGRTVASGIEIAGVPVTIDERGVTVNGQNAPLNTAATALVNTAISGAGMTIAVSQPSGKPDGASVTYDAGSLVFVWRQSADMTMTAVLGGASVSVASTPAFSFRSPPVGGSTPLPPAPVAPGTSVPGVTVPGTPGVPGTGTSGPAPVAGGPVPGPVVAEPVPVTVASRLGLPDGVSPVVVALGLAGAGLVAAGFRRLPDRVLQAPAVTCLLEESP